MSIRAKGGSEAAAISADAGAAGGVTLLEARSGRERMPVRPL